MITFWRIPALNALSTILAILISISLTFAPGASAFAATHERVAPTMGVSADSDTAMAGMDMSDCMKAMSGGGTANSSSKSDCKCCDTKSKCPDQATCVTKCCKVIGALKSAGTMIAIATIQYRRAEPAKPPNWVSTPPAPPPRS